MVIGIFLFSTTVLSSNPGYSALIAGQQSNSASIEEGQGDYIDLEEDRAYHAAVNEKDPKKRTEMLYEFYRKYPDSVLLRRSDYEEIEQIIAVQNDYYAASQKSDIEKRAAALLDILKKYPDSDPATNIQTDYMSILKALWDNKNYELLESLAGKWLELYPDNREAHALTAEAAINLNQFEKCGKSLEAIYATDPSPGLAKQILICYQNTDNLAKRIEWADILFALPDFDSDYMLRFDCMMKFYEEINIAKAAEYANFTLKSIHLAEQEGEKIQEQIQRVRRICYHVIASDFFEKSEYAGAITFFKKAVQNEPYWQGYYKIGVCLEYQKEIEDAILYYAMADILSEENTSEAKSRMEKLYKALHNQTLVGIEKVYRKAGEMLDGNPDS
ncbi:MAG: hypothetical protein P8Z37_15225 [Acidobacteriota bacterium]